MTNVSLWAVSGGSHAGWGQVRMWGTETQLHVGRDSKGKGASRPSELTAEAERGALAIKERKKTALRRKVRDAAGVLWGRRAGGGKRAVSLGLRLFYSGANLREIARRLIYLNSY